MTEKQARQHLKRIWFHVHHLQNALNEAHWKDLIEYPKDTPYMDTCCGALNRLQGLVERYTNDNLAKIIQRTIRASVR